MPRWTVVVGENDIIALERTDDGLVVIDIPKSPVVADRSAVEDLRRKLGAAIADDEVPPL